MLERHDVGRKCDLPMGRGCCVTLREAEEVGLGLKLKGNKWVIGSKSKRLVLERHGDGEKGKELRVGMEGLEG